MKYYISNELGSVYRLEDNTLEYAPIYANGTFDSYDFYPVEDSIEMVVFQGRTTDLNAVYELITKELE